jgi:hypothetical protein
MSVDFATYSGSILTIDLRQLEYAMYSESLNPEQYDYRDPNSQISFQKISKSYLFIADPAYRITGQLLADQWVISYDENYSGFGHVMFVAQGDDPSVSGNRKDINDVLASYFYDGVLPINSFQDVYIKVVKLADPTYITGTFFTPSQPYLQMTYTAPSTPLQLNAGATIRIPYNTVSDTVEPDTADDGRIIPVLTGSGMGIVQLSVAGRYLIEASFELIQTSTSTTVPILGSAVLKLNGTTFKQIESTLTKQSTNLQGTVSIVGVLRVKDSDLTNTTYPNKAVLEVFGKHDSTSAMSIIPTNFTELAITFLG